MCNVLIVGNRETMDSYCQYRQMYLANGFNLVYRLEDADLVQFTGGEDVTPLLYGHQAHESTYNNENRDRLEQEIFVEAEAQQIPMVGICRGGQFLNVMNGGTTYQDVDNHATANGHVAIDTVTYLEYQVSSTHHQMMRPSDSANVLLYARLATKKVAFDPEFEVFEDCCQGEFKAVLEVDTEACYYPETNSLCFQPHPEFFNRNHECQVLFFEYVEEYLGVILPCKEGVAC